MTTLSLLAVTAPTRVDPVQLFMDADIVVQLVMLGLVLASIWVWATVIAFIWRLRSALKAGGQVIVVDRDRATKQHGIPPKLLFCEFDAVGYRLVEFAERPEVGAYFARFERKGKAPAPAAIKTCKETAKRG